MSRRFRHIAVAFVAGAVSVPGLSLAEMPELSGFVAAEMRLFPGDTSFDGQRRSRLSPSVVVEPEAVVEWNGGEDRFTLVPFARIDADDDNRSHFDLREAAWLRLGDRWDLTAGISKVFWGVTESRHLVDIVNQTDGVEDIDGEDKLGQPMVALNLQREYGNFGFFVLPWFRERTFPDAEARLRGGLPVDTDQSTYDSAAEHRHIDVALRWSHSVGDLDIGISHFHGTSREARLIPAPRNGGGITLVPQYDLIDQTALDAQLTKGAWLWKLEALTRSGHGQRFAASVAGFEYTFFQVFRTPADIGVLVEHQYDGRKEKAPLTIADNDVFFGARLALNDAQDTTALIGATVDRQNRETLLFLEAERRLSDNWTATLEARAFVNVQEGSALAGIRRDDFLQFRLARYF